jgi:4'-phosphopantetheinyl transferase
MNSKCDKLSTFYEIWGCKESYTKAIGIGLYLELQELSFSNQDKQVRMVIWLFLLYSFNFC